RGGERMVSRTRVLLRPVRVLLCGLALAATAIVIAACGSSDDSSTTAAPAPASTTAAATDQAGTGPIVSEDGGCGTLPAVPPNDPNGVLETLSEEYQRAYMGFTDFPLVQSPWSDWKPAKESGWHV